MSEGEAGVLEPYDDREHQRQAVVLGMWIFLAAELIFFGGLVLAFNEFRLAYPDAFARAGSRTNLPLGALNTTVLLSSSLSMALAVQGGSPRRVRGFLALTLLLGLAFVAVKGLEYRLDIQDHLFPGEGFRFPGSESDHAELFFLFYFAMTGIHALHLLIGIGLLGFLALDPTRTRSVEAVGLYWHFVDIVWVFLFPMLYLLGRHHG